MENAEGKSPYTIAKEEGVPFIDKMKELASEGNQRAKEMLDKHAPHGDFLEASIKERNSDLEREFAWDAQEFVVEMLRQIQPDNSGQIEGEIGFSDSIMHDLTDEQKDNLSNIEVNYNLVFNDEKEIA